MKILLHFSGYGTECRYILQSTVLTLNTNPSVAVVKSFVPPTTPAPVEFTGEVLKCQFLHENEGWVTHDKWYLLPDIKAGPIYNEYGAQVGENISSPDRVLKQVTRSWEQHDGGFFRGQPTTFRPERVFVEP